MPISILLGHHPETQQKLYLRDNIGLDNSFGVTIIASTSGYGKTELLKNIMIQQSKVRLLVFFDFYEDYKNMDLPNFSQENKIYMRMKNIYNLDIKNCGIMLQDMSKVDWRGIGFPEKTSMQLMDLIKKYPELNVEELIEEIEKLPTNTKELGDYDGKVELKTFIQTAVKGAMLRNISFVKDLFIEEDSGKIRLTRDLFKDLFEQRRNIRIRFDTSNISGLKMKTYTGIILRLMSRLLYFKPAVCIDEADKIFPETSESEQAQVPSSVVWIIEYVRKIARRNNIMMYFVIQDFRALHSAIIENAHNFIVGSGVAGINRLDGIIPSYIRGGFSYLKWNYDENYREFGFYRKGRRGFGKFVPLDSLSFPRKPFWK